MQWFKKLLWGQPAHNVPPVEVHVVEGATLDELNAANIEPGRQVDALRERRQVLKVEIDKRHTLRDAPGSK